MELWNKLVNKCECSPELPASYPQRGESAILAIFQRAMFIVSSGSKLETAEID